MTSEYKHPSLWGCIRGTSKWSDYFNIPNAVSISWKRNSENSNKAILNSTSSENLEDNSTKTLKVEGREDKLTSNGSPSVAHEEIDRRKVAIYNQFFQPYSISETADNSNKFSTTYNQFVSDNKSFPKSILTAERDLEIPTTENKICYLSDDENQRTAHINAKQGNLSSNDTSEVDSESSTIVFRDKQRCSEDWKENGRTYLRRGKTESELLKEVFEEVNKGDMRGVNKFREENERKKSNRESWDKSTGNTKKGMPDSKSHIASKEPERRPAKEFSSYVCPTSSPTRIKVEMTEQEPPTEVLEHTKSEAKSRSLVASPSTAAMEIIDKGHSAQVEENVDVNMPSEHPKSKNEIRPVSIVDSPNKTMEMTDRKRRTNDTSLPYPNGENESTFSLSKTNTAMKTTDKQHATKLEENVNVGTSSEYPKRESKVGPSSFVGSSKTTVGTTEHPVELGEEVDDRISNYTASEYPKDGSELSSTSLADYSGRETTSDDDGHLSDYTGSFTAESTSEDESMLKRSSANRVGFTGAEKDAEDGKLVKLFSGPTPQPSPPIELAGGLSKMVKTSNSASPSSSSFRTGEALKSKCNLIRQASEKMLRVNKLVRLIVFKKPKHGIGSNASALNYETQQNCEYHGHNASYNTNSSLRSDPNQNPIHQREVFLLKGRSKDLHFPERNKAVNITEEILGRNDMSNFQPYQHQTYIYNAQENVKPTRLISDINTGTHNRSAMKKVSFMRDFPVVHRKGCENKLRDCSESRSGQNVLELGKNKCYSNVYSKTSQPVPVVKTLCDECRQNGKNGGGS